MVARLVSTSLVMLAVMMVSPALAGGLTTAGAFLQTFALDAQTYLYGGAAILFLGALLMAGASGFMHLTNLLGVSIYYAILASIGAGVISIFLAGVGLAPGAELPGLDGLQQAAPVRLPALGTLHGIMIVLLWGVIGVWLLAGMRWVGRVVARGRAGRARA